MSNHTPRVTKDEVTDLLTFLGANVDVALVDGEAKMADKYREFQATVRGLVDLVGELPTGHGAPDAGAATRNSRQASDAADDADTHLYIDFSGSIMPGDNFDVIAAEIERVKAAASTAGHAITAFFTPFTHQIVHGDYPLVVTHSSPTRAELKRHLDQIPLNGGGTDFRVVWHRINGDAERSARRNVIITDLEWFTDAETMRREQPINVSYAVLPRARPAATSTFKRLLQDAGLQYTTPIRFY